MASKRNRQGEDDRLPKRSKNACKPFRETGLGKLPPEIRQKIFISLIATPPSYGGHDFAIKSAGPKNSASAQKKFVHIKASWHQVTQTCRQIYLESYPLFFASESYYLASPQELRQVLDYGCELTPLHRGCVLDDLGCRHGLSHRFRRSIITALCLEGFVIDYPLYTKEQIDEILSDPTDFRSAGRTRQQLEAQTFKTVAFLACDKLSALPNLKTVGLRMRVGDEMEYINFMYGVSKMSRGLVEFVDQGMWLIRNQHPNDVWRIQYAIFTFANYATDKDMERISYDRHRIEEEVTDIDSRAPGLQEGDERYVEVQIQRTKRDDDVEEPFSEMVDDLQTTPLELQDILLPAHGEVEGELEVPQLEMEDDLRDILLPAHGEVEGELDEPFMEIEDDLEYQGIQLPSDDEAEIELPEVPPLEMEDDLQISPLDKDLRGTELEQGIFSTSESQDDYNSQSNGHSNQKNGHALSETARHDVSSIQSAEPSLQQAEESLLPTYSTFVWDPVPTNTDSSRKFQTYSDDEDGNFQNESRLGDQVPQSAINKEAKTERHRRIRKRLLRQAQQPWSRFSDIPYPDTEEGIGSFHDWQELADLVTNEQTETAVQELIQSSTTSSEIREHGIKNRGAMSQKATSLEKQPVTVLPEWFWSLTTFGQIWTILLTFCYSWLLITFLTASS